MNGNRCTLLVNSCDAYSDVWDLFFAGIKAQWSDCKYPIVLNTESKKYPNDMGVVVHNFQPRPGMDCWGERYKKTLRDIETKYVMPVLEDFVLTEKFTGNDLIEQVMDWMDENPDIGVFYLHKHPFVFQKETEYPGFGIMPQKAEYKLTTAFGVWRKEYLEKCIKGFENPWEWEMYVTRHAWKLKEKEYALLDNQKEVYVFPWGGVIRRGLWHPEAKILAEKYGIEIDFSIRGFMDENDPYRNKEIYSLRKHFPKDLGKSIFWSELKKRVIDKTRKIRCEI